MEDSYKIQIKELESENEELKEAVKNATNNLELLAGKAEKYFNEKSYLEEGHSQDLKRIHELEKQTQTQQQSITCISENSTKTIQALQEELQTLRANYEDKCQIIASFQEEKSSKLNKDCPGDKSSSDESCVGNFAPLAHSSGKKFKAEEEKLQEVVHEFHNSVSRMIVTECQSKQDKDRITDLELQLSEIWKQKEIEVVAARSCREEEIRNLKRIIDTLMANLESEKRRSESLQKGVGEQKMTIVNLQEALVRTKNKLESLRTKNVSDWEHCYELIGRMTKIILKTEEEVASYFEQLVVRLRDENVELEKSLFYNDQDLEIYEMRLAKYQQFYKELQNQCRDLKVQLESALTDKDEQEGFVEDLNEHLTDCQKELAELFNILVTTSEEQTEKQIQCDQIASLKEELQKLNEKLNVTLDEVTKEKDRNSKLSASLMRSKCLCSTMKKEIVAAHKKLENAAQKMSQDAREIKSYKFELEEQQKLLYSLREESINYKERLEDKENQCLQIQKQVANVQQEFQLEVNHYQLTIDELRSKVDQMECNCRDLGKELSKTRIQITEYEDQNSNLKQIIVEKETKYITQCNKYQCEQERLIALVNQLEFRVTKLHNELQEKNELLMDLKKELCNGEELRQEGVVELKNEINVMIQTQNALKTENERLQLQLSQLRTKLSHNEEKTKNLMSELEQCLIDLQNVQSDKDFLLQKNDQLVAQLQALQDLCHTKTESMVNLEMELNDSKNLRDTLCNESRHVIEHVRSWLQEQRKINLELNERIKHKNETISKLNVEKRSLQQKLKQMYINSACSRQTDSRNSSCDVNSPYGGTFQQYPVQIIQSPGVMMSSSSRTNNCWSLGSVESPVCSLNDDSDFENDQMYEEPPHVWIHRVESLTEELQRSNQYWKDRMSEQDREFSVTKDK